MKASASSVLVFSFQISRIHNSRSNNSNNSKGSKYLERSADFNKIIKETMFKSDSLIKNKSGMPFSDNYNPRHLVLNKRNRTKREAQEEGMEISSRIFEGLSSSPFQFSDTMYRDVR